LGALIQAATQALCIKAGFIGAGIVKTQFLERTSVSAAGAIASHDPEARFPLFTETLQAELDHRD
jgi:hypothetical protein